MEVCAPIHVIRSAQYIVDCCRRGGGNPVMIQGAMDIVQAHANKRQQQDRYGK